MGPNLKRGKVAMAEQLGWHELDWWRGVIRKARFQVRAVMTMLQKTHKTLVRHLRPLTGKSPQKWMDEERMKAAPAVIVEHGCLKRAADELGLSDENQLSKKFKSFYGEPPIGYLKRTGLLKPKCNGKQSSD